MGEKKRNEAAVKSWKKVLFVTAAILFIVVMVVSSTGMNWISGIAPIKPGDSVVVDFTLYDASGSPFLTTSQQVYKEQAAKGRGILFGKQLAVTANRSLTQAIYPEMVYSPTNSEGYEEFALYNPEYNAISNAVVGMKTNENKKVSLATGMATSTLITPSDLKKAGLNVSALRVGESLSMGVSENPNAAEGNTSAGSYIRIGQVSRMSDAGVVVDFGYPYADITVVSFSHT